MTQDLTIDLRAIGVIHTEVPDEQVARRRREIISTIELWPDYAAGLTGIEGYSHLFILRAGSEAPLDG